MTNFLDLDVNQLLAVFLDACHDGDRVVAFHTVDDLRSRIWHSEAKVLPRDPRQQPEEKAAARERIIETERLRAENKRLLAASVALAQCRDALTEILQYRPNEPPRKIYVKAQKAIAAANAALK